MKKTLAIVLALVMILSLATTAFAANDGTITVNNAAIGKEYKAYKILDATVNGDAIAYTTTAAMKDVIGAVGSPFNVATEPDANGNYSVTSTADVSTIKDWIADNLSSFEAISATTGVTDDKATATTVQWAGLAYGYYYVTSSLGSEVTIDSVNPSATIIDKNDSQPNTPVKTADETAQIGDEVSFTITFNATNFVTESTDDADGEPEQITEYTITDTPNGYDIDVSTLAVKVGDVDITSLITDEAVNADTGVLSFTIPWVDGDGKNIYADPSVVTITYKGTVNADAFDGAAENEVTIANDAQDDVLTAEDTTTNYNLTINKVDGENEALEGAKFELLRNGTALSLIALTDDEITALGIVKAEKTVYYRVAYTGETGTTTIDMSEATSAVIYGLDGADTYSIKEIEAPEGYNKLSTNIDHAMENANGTEEVTNLQGTELPTTGGIGTTLFYIFGAVLVVGAAVLLITKKRMSAEA